MKVLLTGARGNLGQHIAKVADFDIVELNRADWGRAEDLFSQDIDLVVHAGADLKHDISQDPDVVCESNLMATVRALKFTRQSQAKKFVFISSAAVYGNSSDTSEESSCRPLSINGQTKYLCEMMIERFCLANDIRYEIYRIFNTYGGDDSFSVIQKLQDACLSGGEFLLNNNGVSQRDYVHVEDAAEVVCRLIKLDLSHNVYNIGTGSSTKISDVVERACRKYPDLKIQYGTSREVEYSRANITRLRSVLDFKFRNVLDFFE